MATIPANGVYTKLMVPRFDEREMVQNGTLFQAIVNSPTGYSVFTDQTAIDVDIIRATKQIAKFRDRGVDSYISGSTQKTTKAARYTSKAVPFPLIEEKGNLTASQFRERIAGENPYAAYSPARRARELAFDQHRFHLGNIFRKVEALAASAVLTGSHAFNEAGDVVDFGRDSNLTAAASSVWTTAAYDPITNDLEPMMNQLHLLHTKATYCIMGREAWTAFYNNDVIKDLADSRRMSFTALGSPIAGEIPQVPARLRKLADAGAIYQGWIKVGSRDLHIFTYDDFYFDDAGTEQYYMNPKDVFMSDVDVRYDRYFGSGEMTEDAIDAQIYSMVFGVGPGSVNMSNMFGKVQGAKLLDARMMRYAAEAIKSSLKSLLLSQRYR